MRTPPAPPKDLSASAQKWWATLVNDYELAPGDSAGVFLLETMLRAHDRMIQARALIVEHGLVTMDAKGQLRPNPAAVIERDSRAAMMAALKSLNFDFEPTNKVGRPAKG